MPAGEAVPEVLHDGQAPQGRRQGGGDRPRGALLRRPRARDRRGEAGRLRAKDREEGRRHRLRPRVDNVRGGLREGGPRRHGVRGVPPLRRRSRLRHPRVPPPEGDRQARDRGDQAARRPSSAARASSGTSSTKTGSTPSSSAREQGFRSSWGSKARTSTASFRRTSI